VLYIQDTIVALATPPGVGAIGVIRLSGPHSFSILQKVFQGKTSPFNFESHKLYHGRIVDRANIMLDDVLAVCMKAPQTFTGEECVEIQSHGSPVNISRIIKLLISHGARLAEPGEFSKRAFLNGKIDLSQAEALVDLIQAKSEIQAQNALSQISGYLFEIIKDIRVKVAESRALIEIGFDFSDQDLTIIEKANIISILESIYQKIDNLIGSFSAGQLLSHGVKIALVGKPNVGKSTLMNTLLKEDKSIIHHLPGTTRDVVSGELFIKGVPVYLYDTAGIRETSDEVEKMGVQKSQEVLNQSDCLLFLCDSSRVLDEYDQQLWDLVKDKQFIVVMTKCDLPSAWSSFPFAALSDDCLPVHISVKNEWGLSDLMACIERKIFKDVHNYEHNYVLNNVRHYKSLQMAHQILGHVLEQFTKDQIQEECLVEELKSVSEHLGEITGEINSETVLDVIFSKFCIGK